MFRHFKAALGQLLEGKDFYRIDGHTARAEVENLRQQGRLYPSSVHAILLTASGYQRLMGRHLSSRRIGPMEEEQLRPIPFFPET